MMVHGPGGVGKSTFFAGAPNPVFITTEDGLASMDVAKFPKAESYADVVAAIDELTTQPHDFKSVVVDSVDWLEPLVMAEVAREGGVKSIDDVDFAKLYGKVPLKWRELLSKFEKLQASRKVSLFFICHSVSKMQKNAEGSDFETVDLKLLVHNKANVTELWKEFVDVLGYATLEVAVDAKRKAKSSGARILRVHPNPSFAAKSRYPLPDRMALDWNEFESELKAARPQDPKVTMAAITAMLVDASPELATTTQGHLDRAAGDAVKLAKLLNWLSTKVNE